MQPARPSSVLVVGGKAFIRNLAGCFASTLLDVESRDRGDAISSCAQGIECLG
jgi:hypothetical protein